MGSQVLGRITGSAEGPRGPDAAMSLEVPEEWITRGATIEIELPRNLACAACGGGGCDACERSGAVSLRDRKAPVELVEVTLPAPGATDDVPSTRRRGMLLRIPDRGGEPAEGMDLPRGNLLLSVRPGAEPARGVRRLAHPSVPPPPPPQVVRQPEPGAAEDSARQPISPLAWLLAALVAAAFAAWLLR